MSEPSLKRAWNTSDSPFVSLLGTNHIPTRSELGMLKALLIDPELDLSQLEVEIVRLQTVLDRLLLRKRNVEEYIMAHKALASPVRQLPTEILAEIFVQCLPSDYPVRDPSEAPLLLTRICRGWRRVALDTPWLWRSLHVYLPQNLSSAACSRRIEGVTAWLERSGSLPTSISFHGSTILSRVRLNQPVPIPHELSERSRNNMESMIRTLLRFSDNFVQLFLSLPSVNLLTFSEMAPSIFPNLTSLKLQVRDPFTAGGLGLPATYSKERMKFTPLFTAMPRLKMLHIDQTFDRNYDYSSLSCSWKNLTAIVIMDFLSPQQTETILAETLQLRSLTLGIIFTESNPISRKGIHLPHLSELRLNINCRRTGMEGGGWMPLAVLNAAEDGMKSVLTWFQSSDKLKSLSFSAAHVSLREMVFSQWPFAGMPFHNLETLELEIALNTRASQGLAECLSQSYNLVTFRYNALNPEGQLEDLHFLGLTPSSHNPNAWCPKLQNFQILDSYHHFSQARVQFGREYAGPCASGVVVTFLQRRFEMSLKFCSITFPQKLSFTEHELDTLRSLQKQGHKLRLRYTVPARRDEWISQDQPDTGLRTSSSTGSIHPQPNVRNVWNDSQSDDTNGHYVSAVIV